MKTHRTVLLLLCLVTSLSAWGQEYFLHDYYGQGDHREAALEDLLSSIGQAVRFSPPRLLDTYRDEISRATVESIQNGKVLLSLRGTTLDALFQARQTRTERILNQGRKATDASIRMTYYRWAWYYLASLPPGHELTGKDEVQRWILSHSDIRPGKLPVPMTHIEREVEQIRRIIGDLPAFPQRTEARETPPVPKGKVRAEQAQPVEENARPRVLTSSPRLVFQTLSTPPSGILAPSPLPPAVLSPKSESEIPLRTSILAVAGLVPEPVWGAVVCIRRRWGGLLSFQSDFHRTLSGYPAYSDGNRPGGEGYLWPSGHSHCAHLRMTAGVSYAPRPWMDTFLSVGYGYRTVWWEDQDQDWARIEDLSARGTALSGGFIFHYKWLSALVETGTVAFQTLGVSLGLGMTF